VVLIDARFLPVLRSHFGRHCEVIAQDDGRVRARVAAHMARSIAEQLAGWGAMVEVVEPESVRAELARIGLELTERYAQ
jgi:predicted DNA-binding transcriptional regulator YafY